jgi:hypothetical protein
MLTKRDYETLADLDAANRNLTDVGHRKGWAKPMDCGGSNGSHHSATLARLAERGLAVRRGYCPGIRHVWTYKITQAGFDLLAARKQAHTRG